MASASSARDPIPLAVLDASAAGWVKVEGSKLLPLTAPPTVPGSGAVGGCRGLGIMAASEV